MPGFPDEQKDLNVIERDVKARVNSAYALQSFLGENREWIIPSVVIPIAAALGGRIWRAWVRRKGNKLEGN